ncbi:MAG: hypothetical protein PVH60_11530 [Anaerolineales bacterium]
MPHAIQSRLPIILLFIILSACSPSEPQTTVAQPSETPFPATETTVPSSTPSPTLTQPPTSTASPSPSPTITASPTLENTSTPTLTATPEAAVAVAQGQINCRYGPDKAYLYAWGLSEGDRADIKGKNATGDWLWVTPHDTVWNCWITASAVELNVAIEEIDVVYPQLLTNSEVGPPKGVSAVRNGDKVTISWNPAPPAIDLGYLIEARICLGAYQWDMVFRTQNTSYTITDPKTCGAASYGQLRVFNKLGYSTAVKINWP